ncbi:SDR family NAD(P)-dependent oxidoreductase [Rhodococcus sp. NM-2]|uniref:SDR family NAD(P)-dependent oxidoreductase n=1 Tax=Rhodococcus TaxID=1827 RepID=UPI002476735D|nr:SDR family NAD(P)-dependent oxidoreductase [Rhodococcus opacus]MDH6286624.1 NAD(P)-dependent dehydrogenase (short-subunit alcohol dehydrogenase family) [Rhodococcus opacus]
MSRTLEENLVGRRVLITGAARGIGAGLARRLHERGARVGLLGLEPELLEQTATTCGRAPWRRCDTRDRRAVEDSFDYLTDRLGGLDVVVANAGVTPPAHIVEGDPEVMRYAIEVNVMGTYHTLRAAGPYIGHRNGYALVVASSTTFSPLRGVHGATRGGAEELGEALRDEMKSLGTRVGIARLGEIDTDRTLIDFDGVAVPPPRGSALTRTSSITVAVDALERAIAGRKNRIYAPSRVPGKDSVRMLALRATEMTRSIELRAHAAVPTRGRVEGEGAA